jgi:hypothetical protein
MGHGAHHESTVEAATRLVVVPEGNANGRRQDDHRMVARRHPCAVERSSPFWT